MSKPSAPTPPDPQATAAAQTGTNVATAIANAALKNVNQITPYGSLTYNETGSKNIFDPSTGKNYDVPIYTATQTLSPEQQALLGKTQAAQGNLADTAQQQSGFLKDYLATPANLDTANKATEDKLFQLGASRLDPRFATEEDQLRTRLANQGIQEGSPAFTRAMRDFTQGKNDAYNQLALTGHGQAFNEALTERQEPINEITALLSGSQVSQPNYAPNNMPTIPTTDYAGIVNNNFNQQEQNYQSQMSNYNSLMGGMFSLASAPLYGMKFSDERLKTDIEKVGKVNGHNLYTYRYKAGGPMQLGVMAQEVEKKQPSAVKKDPVSGFRMVDYDKALKLGAR